MYRPSRLWAPTALAVTLTLLGCGQERSSQAGSEVPSDPAADPPPHAPARGGTRARCVYVPVYSHLGARETNDRALLSVTLSVRNVDPAESVSLTHVDYFDTSGHRVRRYLSSARDLAPLETVEFSVATRDEAGGSGANFLVYWVGPSDAHPLLTEAVMRTGYLAFTSRGVELERPPVLDEGAGVNEGPAGP